jgi:hypothetical protein
MHYEQETVKIHCTDKDQFLQASVISRSQHGIVMTLENGAIRLQFVKMPNKNMYIANMSGYEFVYDPTK